MAPNSPACSFIHASMAGSRSTAPSNRSNSVLIISLLSAFESCGYVTEGLPVIRECLQSVLTSLLAATNRRNRRQFYEKTVSPPFGHRDQAGEVDLVLQFCRIATGSGDNENNRRGDRLPFRRPACGHKRPSNQRN